ncbi:hypothetical protein [Sphingomonas sp. 3-13AW]|uniref:hypothetical protein n=1 Tax=Sphingomonas sp. 3-13AW TaxID=3050450 RepID=UPI003BB73D93
MKRAIELVRYERDFLPESIARRVRTIVKIRNGALTLALALCVWLPIAIRTQTPGQFLSMMVAYLTLWAIAAGLLWYVVVQTRYTAMEVLEEVAERHPDEVTRLANLMRVPWYKLPFGPWYKAMYLPAFVRRRLERIKNRF